MAVRAAPPQTWPPLVDGEWALGIVRDRARWLIPPGGVYDATDFWLHQPGFAQKRGGWERHSAVLGSSTSVAAVATLHIPTRVVAVGSDGTLYNVTSESSPQAISTASCFTPAQNPPQYVDFLIFTDSTGAAAPKKVDTSGAAGAIAVSALGGSPPASSQAIVHASRIVLARGTTASGYLNRLWFSELPDVESTWDTTNKFLDVTGEVTGLASTGGVLLVFGVNRIERILGGVPPGETGEDMELQPLAGVGCLDARSIVHLDTAVIFAGQEGVWITNGSGVESLTQKEDGTGIQTYWRSLFAARAVRQLVGGMLNRDFYIVSVLNSSNATVATLACHLPTRSWVRLTNCGARMYAQGRDEEENSELYMASNTTGYVNRMQSMLAPSATYKNDGDSTAVAPMLELRPFDGGPGVKAYGHAHISLDMRDAATDNPTMAVTAAPGLEAPTFTAVAESPLAETTALARKRVTLSQDAQALTLRLTQTNASSKTEIYLVEAEVRPYGLQADGQ